MAKGFFAKNLNSLHAADDDAEATLRGLGQGEIVEVTVKRPRNIRHHRMFFALLNLVWQNTDQEKWPTVDDLLTEVKLVTGHYDRRVISFEGGRYNVLTPRSISFAAMDQVGFDAFFQRVCDWVQENVVPGVSSTEWSTEIETMIGTQSTASILAQPEPEGGEA